MTGAKIIALMIGAATALAKWFNDIMEGNRPFVYWHFPMVLFIGAVLGFLGDEVALVLGKESLRGIFSGALAASGSYGFEFITRFATKKK